MVRRRLVVAIGAVKKLRIWKIKSLQSRILLLLCRDFLEFFTAPIGISLGLQIFAMVSIIKCSRRLENLREQLFSLLIGFFSLYNYIVHIKCVSINKIFYLYLPLDFFSNIGYNIPNIIFYPVKDITAIKCHLVVWAFDYGARSPAQDGAVNHVRRGTEQH